MWTLKRKHYNQDGICDSVSIHKRKSFEEAYKIAIENQDANARFYLACN